MKISKEGWEPMARELMSKRKKFTVPNWDYFNNNDAIALSKEFNYAVYIEISNGKRKPRVLFEPESN